MGEFAISLSNVSKCYRRYARPVDRLKELLLPGKSRAEEFWALRDISLEIPKGETVGIVGRNGSGKSTLLQIIAGTLQPTSGEVLVNGRVSALLELGSGFNPEFTGRQNVFFNGRILGLSQDEIEAKFDEIAAFADIGDFIDEPVKTYSSGMFVRLAFAVAVNVQPEVFIVDEALAVGDVIFQHKCMRRIKALMDSGATTLFVSHDAGAVKTLCKYAYMLNNGTVYTRGKPNDVFIEYMKLATQIELEQVESETEKCDSLSERTVDPKSSLKRQSINTENEDIERNETRRGSCRAKIENIKIFHENGDLAINNPVFEFNEEMEIVAEVIFQESLSDFIFGFYICDKNGNEVIGSNTYEEGKRLGGVSVGERVIFSLKFRLPLRPGGYSLTVAGAENYTTPTCDWIDNVIIFKVLPPNTGKLILSLVDIPLQIKVSHKIKEVTLLKI